MSGKWLEVRGDERKASGGGWKVSGDGWKWVESERR